MSIIALLLLFFNLVLNFPLVQTSLTHGIANYYSKKFHTKIHIGKVDFEFLKKLVLRDVYIQDLHGDTLLYAAALKFDIGQLSFKTHELYLSNIDIEKAKVHLTTYKNENSLNLQFLLDGFASTDTTKSAGPPWKFAFGSLSLNNIDFRLLNQHDTGSDNYGINTSNLRVHAVYSKINMIKFIGDTIRATIENLSAKEESGFILKKFSCYVDLSPRGMELDALKIETPNTLISTDLIFKYSKFSDFNDFTNKVTMKAIFNKSRVCFEDVSYFAHGLKAVNNCFTLSGKYTGTVNHLKAQNMSIGWGKFSKLEGDAQLDNITEIDSAIMKVNITNLVTSKEEIEDLPIPPFDKKGNIKLPNNINTLQTIYFTGSFDGTIHSFKATGGMSTAIGGISANLHLWENPRSKETQYTGVLETQNFNLGQFWRVANLGAVTTSLSINGEGLTKQNADATLSGIIQSATYRKYTYQNAQLSGELKKGYFSGFAKIVDPHLILNFNGKINLASQNSVFQFESHITKANLTALHIITDTSVYAMLSAHIKVNAKGNTLDNLEGSVSIDSAFYSVKKETYHLNHLTLTSTLKGDYHTINLSSDYADGKLSGHFHLANTLECLQNLMALYIPSVFPKEKHNKGEKNGHSYSLSLHFNEDTGLTNLFLPGLKIASGTTVKGRYDEATDNFYFNGSSNEIDISSKKLKNWKVNATGDGSSMVFNLGCDTLCLSDSAYAANFEIKGNIRKDTLHYAILWNNDSANFARIPGYIGFPNKSRAEFKLLHPIVSIADSDWKINNDNLIVHDSSRWTIQSFTILHNSGSSISLQGKISANNNDRLDISLHNINLANLVPQSTSLEGELSGTVSIWGLLDHPFFTSALHFSGLVFNNQFIGDGALNSRWDTLSQAILMSGNFLRQGTQIFSIAGAYTPGSSKNSLNMDAHLFNFPTKLFQPYLKDVCSVLDGSLSGQVHISGVPAKPLIYGNVTASLNKMKFDYLNTSYHSPGIHIKIIPDTFQIISSLLLDEANDTAYYWGTFTHQNFKNLQMDFNLDAKNFLCLNTTESQNSSYFGKGVVTGTMRIYGLLDALHIDANITTDKNTVFNIPLENASELDQANYIEFKSKGKSKHTKPGYKVSLGGLQLDFTVHTTSKATTRILFSSKGEILEGHGDGTILFSMDNIGDINMRGNYTVTSGYYNFILLNIINKKFILQPGGTIAWNGDPYNANINLTTYYSTGASLQPFFPQDVTGVYSKRFPVKCDLDLTGKLTSPDISFGIELPTVDNDTKQVVESYLSNEDELKTQVFSLLIINSFMPVGAGIGNASGGAAGVATSASVLSNQLTNLINKINGVNLAFDYQPGSSINPTEAKLALSKEFLNGKVLVNTDVGTVSGIPSGTQSSGNFVGEVEIEAPISKNRKLKVKAFNKANDNTQLNALNAPYTQGAGLSYKEGFNTFKELLGKLFNKKKRDKELTDDTSSK